MRSAFFGVPLWSAARYLRAGLVRVAQMVGTVEHPEIPSHIAQFLDRHIDSVMQLEVLLLMHLRAERRWLAKEVATELRIDPAWTETALDRLCNAGILVRNDQTYQFAPAAPELEQSIAQLAQLYAERRVTIIGMIFSEPADPIRQFTDAFRIRKDEQR